MRYSPLACAVWTMSSIVKRLLHRADAQRLVELRVVGEVAVVVLEIQDDAVQALRLEEVQVGLQPSAGCPARET